MVKNEISKNRGGKRAILAMTFVIAAFTSYMITCNVLTVKIMEEKDWYQTSLESFLGGQPDKFIKLPNDRVIDIVRSSGAQVTDELIEELPKWEEVLNLYGDKPRIIGMDTCSTFQQRVHQQEAYIGAAGIFNSGTNIFSKLLMEHCSLPDDEGRRKDEVNKSGMLYQVPWGKHSPLSWRLNHVTESTGPGVNFVANDGGEGVKQDNVLPVVIIKDPYHWMGSMCRHPYGAMWIHSERHCPNLVLTVDEESNRKRRRKREYRDKARRRRVKAKDGTLAELQDAILDRRKLREEGIQEESPNTVQVSVDYDSKKKRLSYDSLADIWSQWYTDYLDAHDLPRLMIRYEDLLLYPTEIVTTVCQCGGGTVINAENGINHVEESAKPFHHTNPTGLVKAISRYLKEDHRTDTMTENDLEYAKGAFSSVLMDLFHYSHPNSIKSKIV